ncbi:MAG: site-specific DNA-methyltransferase [Gammaproteobacteria bacterium]|nr:MAG: site-specific DNA-methyltransferase [Gammaproteobacteria bacterium]
MPTLNWIGKDAVVRHHTEVPYRLLEPDADLSCPPAGTGNLIVQGDNLQALKALLPRYAGQVKCIYIDPPYNTGNEGWVYNDNVNSPEIRRWLGEVVGREGETLDRHDRWLCMMYPRLVLLKQFLREDGVIFVSIDDNEVAALRLLMDEVFEARNFMSLLVWKARQHLDSRSLTGVSNDHEYVLVYSKTRFGCKMKGKSRDESKYSNPDHDPRGRWMSRSILGLANAKDRPNLHYDLEDPTTGVRYPCPKNTGWRYSRDTMAEKIAERRILFPKKETGRPREKVFLNELQATAAGFPSVIDGVYTADGSQSVRDIFGQQNFAFPKAPDLVQRLIAQVADNHSLILDSFAGSGTTAHAVLQQNAEDGGNRRFILVEMDPAIARDVTAERVRRVAQGYTNAKGQPVAGLGGGFQFCRLSAEPLFDGKGRIRADVNFAQLAEFAWFVETGTGYTGRADSPLLGVHDGRAIYLLYNGILKDRSIAGGNVLTGPRFDALPGFDGPKVIFAAANRMGARAAREGITFRQTPYALQVS